MNKRIKALWLKALRSGAYHQTMSTLCETDEKGNDSFCCLGVLTDLYLDEKGLGWHRKDKFNEWSRTSTYTYGKAKDLLPISVAKWAGIPAKNLIEDDGGYDIKLDIDPNNKDNDNYCINRAAELNDNGTTFEELADLIEKTL